MSRRAVVDALRQLAFGYELIGDRRARSYGWAAQALRDAEGDVAEMAESGSLLQIRGVGKKTLAVVREALGGEEPEALRELKTRVPPGLFEVRQVRGLGAKKVRTLWERLGITSLGELEYACKENRLLALSGFGAKTQAMILSQISEIRSRRGKLRRDQGARLLEASLAALEAAPGVERAEAAGEYRRGFEVLSGVDVVVAGDTSGLSLDARVRVHRASLEGFGWSLLRASASPEHVAALRARAEERDVDLEAQPEEDDCYAALGLHPTPPERREPGVPLALEGRAVRLVQCSDLRGALHNHTRASDGSDSLGEMQAAARAAGLEYLGISEHSVSADYAGGLDAESLAAQRAEIEALNVDAGCVLLRGVESDIRADGELDYPDEVLEELEFVVASVHGRLDQDRETLTARMERAARHPSTSVIGHPTGRLLLGRAPAAVDIERLLDACAESGCAIELNANPARLDLSAEHAAMARERGVLISIAADAHATRELAHLEHGVAVARRAGLRPGDVLNARSLSELRAFFARSDREALPRGTSIEGSQQASSLAQRRRRTRRNDSTSG